MVEKTAFGPLDVVIFVATLVLSAAIGVFFAVKDRRKKNVENYFYGGRKMSPVPIGFSIAVSFISAITVIGFPAETYLFGMVTIWYSFTLLVPTFFAWLYYIPLIHRLRLKTVFEYLGLRFHPVIRKITSAIEMANTVVYMGATVYLPALALSAVTPISMTWSIIMTSAICTLYTTVGGIKAVVWTDAFQAAIMLIGALSLLIQGTIMVGGFGKVWEALIRTGRDNAWTFDLDPTIRTSFWSIMVGFSTTQTITACVNQSICQRYLSCKSVRDAKIAAITALFPKIAITVVAILSGCVAYAYFDGCDPLKAGKITKSDQMMPYLALEAFQQLPGLSGFFVAAAYSGTLSTVSTGINSVGALFLEDFVIPLKPHMTHTRQLIYSKLTAVAIGILLTSIAFLATLSSQTVISIIFSIRGAFGGPLLGLFTLGVFIPWCNTKGALTGQLVGTAFGLWIALGSLINGKDPKTLHLLPTSTDNCSLDEAVVYGADYSNFSRSYPMTTAALSNATAKPEELVKKTYNPIQAMSFMYYSIAGLVVTIVVGILVSACTGFEDPTKSDPKLFLPIVDNRRLPESVRTFFRFGVPPFIPVQEDEDEDEKVDLHPVEDDEKKQVSPSVSSVNISDPQNSE